MKFKNKILITCAKRISPVLAKEVEGLNLKVNKIDMMSVETEGTMEDAMRLNLHLRTGNRVLFLVESFKANHPDKLYDAVKKIPWEKYIPAEGYISVSSFVQNDYISDTRFPNLKTKDAIVDRLYQRNRVRPDSGPNRDKTVIFLHWRLNECSIYFDTSGETISKHGYRKLPYKAPMIESLAAATLISSQWNMKSPLINPMCGSGTIAIEAALMATRKAPGLFRDNFGFMHVKGYDDALWQSLVKKAKENVLPELDFKIIASDNNKLAIDAANTNAAVANVGHLIDFELCDFRDTTVPEEKGIVFLNPEYGERLGEEEQLALIYREIGDFFKNKCKGYTGYIFTGNLNLAKKVGLKARKRIEFFNSRIDSRLLEYELYSGTKKEK